MVATTVDSLVNKAVSVAQSMAILTTSLIRRVDLVLVRVTMKVDWEFMEIMVPLNLLWISTKIRQSPQQRLKNPLDPQLLNP